MKLQQLGYRVSELPGDGSIEIQPSEELEDGVRVVVRLWRGADSFVYDRQELKALLGAVEHAVRLADQVAEAEA